MKAEKSVGVDVHSTPKTHELENTHEKYVKSASPDSEAGKPQNGGNCVDKPAPPPIGGDKKTVGEI
jgi:hypothetical protein